MNTEWSLDALYTGYDSDAFKKDEKQLDVLKDEICQALASAKEKTEKDALLDILEGLEKYEVTAGKLLSFTSLKQSTNTTDGETSAVLARLERKVADFTKVDVAVKQYIASIENLEELINSDKKLKAYEFILLNIKKSASHLLSEEMEEMIAKMNLSGGAAWSKLFDFLTSTVQVDYKGEKITLPAVRNLAYSEEATVRKEAYEAELECYNKIEDSIAFALNNIKSQVNMLAEVRGYESPLMMTLEQSTMKKETLDAMLSAMREYMPKFHEYLKAKAQMLGHKNGLPWYDLFAPIGSFDKKYSLEEARDYLVDSFRSFSDDMAEMMKTAFNESWIDFYPHAGKVGGAFCSNLSSIKQSRILSNYDGSFNAVDTLAHELGHAYHGMQIENNLPLNLDYSMPVAETASTFNETHITKKAIAEAVGDEKLALLENLLSNTTQTICDIYSRYLFESEVFEQCKNRFLMAEDLKEIMIQAQKEAYGDGLDNDVLHPYMWACKGHYYSESLSFYNFPYAFGALFSMGLYTMFEKEGEAFVPKYREMLKNTPMTSVEGAAKIVGVDLTKPDFWRASLEGFAQLIDEFISLSR